MEVKELRIGDLIYCKTDKGTKVDRALTIIENTEWENGK